MTLDRPERRRRQLIGVILVGLGIVAAVALTFITLHPARIGSRAPEPLTPVRVAGTVVGQPITVGADPYDIEEGSAFIWTTNLASASITQIDPRTGTVVDEIDVGGRPVELKVTEDAIWVANYRDAVTRIDRSTGRSGPPIRTGGENISDIELGAGYLWVSHAESGTVSRISVADQKLTGRPIPVGRRPTSLLFTHETLFVVNGNDRTISTIASSGAVGTPITVESEVGGLETADDVLYIGATDVVIPYELPSLRPGVPVEIPGGRLFEIGAESIWVTYPLENVVRRFDIRTGDPIGTVISGIGEQLIKSQFALGELWLVNSAQNTVVRIRPS